MAKRIAIIISYLIILFVLPIAVAVLFYVLEQRGILPHVKNKQLLLLTNYIVYSVLPITMLIFLHKELINNIKNAGNVINWLIPMILIVYAMAVLGGIFIQMIDHTATTQNQIAINEFQNKNLMFTIYMTVIAAPIAEESTFRYAFLHDVKGGLKYLLLLVSSSAFSLIHLQQNLSVGAFTAYFLIGITLGLIYIKYDNLFFNIMVHGGYNALGLVLSIVNN